LAIECVEVGVVEHDRGGLAAEFERAAANQAPAFGTDRPARRGSGGELAQSESEGGSSRV
jgi:hypothetical protein